MQAQYGKEGVLSLLDVNMMRLKISQSMVTNEYTKGYIENKIHQMTIDVGLLGQNFTHPENSSQGRILLIYKIVQSYKCCHCGEKTKMGMSAFGYFFLPPLMHLDSLSTIIAQAVLLLFNATHNSLLLFPLLQNINISRFQDRFCALHVILHFILGIIY